MVAFIDEHRDVYGVEPICRELPIAPSQYFEAKSRSRDPSCLPRRMRKAYAATYGRDRARLPGKR